MKTKQLLEKRAELIQAMEAINLETRDQVMSDDVVKRFNELETQVNELDLQIRDSDIRTRFDDMKLKNIRESQRPTIHTASIHSHEAALRGWLLGEDASQEQREAAKAFGYNSNEIRTDPVGIKKTSTHGAELVPASLGNSIITELEAMGGIFSLASKFSTSGGEAYTVPTMDLSDVTAGAIVAENVADSDVDLLFGSVTFGAFTVASGVLKISYEMLQDSKFPLTPYVSRALAHGLNKYIAPQLLTGTGTGAMQGILTGVTQKVDAAEVDEVDYGELIDVINTIEPAYLNSAVWCVSKEFAAYIQKQIGTDGRPLWVPPQGGLIQGQPGQLLGFPLYVDHSWANGSIAAGNTVALFGSVKDCLSVRLVNGGPDVRSTTERYWDTRQTAVTAIQRIDSKVLVAKACAKLKMKVGT